ncbi:MAG: hypothetical protein EB015_20395 [Methylocystaceae bacterium]|nr:hypothetical protein [Methylocystaceae bacterium]
MTLEEFCFPMEEGYKGVADQTGMPMRVYNLMRALDLETAEEIAEVNSIQFLLLKGVGFKTINWIEDRLEEVGLAPWLKHMHSVH